MGITGEPVTCNGGELQTPDIGRDVLARLSTAAPAPLLDGGAREYRVCWCLTSAVPGDPGFGITFDTTRREAANDNNAEHGVMLGSRIRW